MISDRTRIGIFGGIAIACLGFAAWNLVLAWNPVADKPPCTMGKPADFGSIDRAWYIFGALIALGAGRLLSRQAGQPPFFTTFANKPDLSRYFIKPGQINSWVAVFGASLVQLLVWLLVTVALAGLVYETAGVSHHEQPWPLTFLVRCLNEGSLAHETTIATYAVTLGVAFIIGNWFWPER